MLYVPQLHLPWKKKYVFGARWSSLLRFILLILGSLGGHGVVLCRETTKPCLHNIIEKAVCMLTNGCLQSVDGYRVLRVIDILRPMLVW